MKKKTVRSPQDRRQDNSVASVLGGYLSADRRKGGDRRRPSGRAAAR